MALRRRLACSDCGFAVEAWSDGNPYFRDERGRKQYAYHPDHENLARCVGNDVAHLCLSCGKQSTVDSLRPRTTCRACKSGPLVPLWEVDGHTCPQCRRGTFVKDPLGFVVS